MAEEQNTQTPQGGGTGNQTPSEGTGESTPAVPSTPPPSINYEEKFKQSQAEAVRLFHENHFINRLSTK